mmetsp:Transcript_45720/g.97474  ORF Transcript_45720/g.97474 Transcript_45720/m.97474 type:complete len:401 (-) Transcript_45720:245-1447(-)|eukprot:CAMPEP_0183351118 /NCGR_PEP_ID=MMETSP0164_2-20130417/23370_1 /TAXON_ID=221442 /ORGANISM="Coccolithus pelagicus ssp braarudi, Strain PLY182g" /LENGTH=400 /DNA_ID=CAMNT_0025523221 /DNA_START=96 /DNA_END=1298 /DNA_ORIENTATION=-
MADESSDARKLKSDAVLHKYELDRLNAENAKTVAKMQAKEEVLRAAVSALKAELKEVTIAKSTLEQKAEQLITQQTESNSSTAIEGATKLAQTETLLEELKNKILLEREGRELAESKTNQLMLKVSEAAAAEEGLRHELKLARSDFKHLSEQQHADVVACASELSNDKAKLQEELGTARAELEKTKAEMASLHESAQLAVDSSAALQAKVENERSGVMYKVEKLQAQLESTRSQLYTAQREATVATAEKTELQTQVAALLLEAKEMRRAAKEEGARQVQMQEELHDIRSHAKASADSKRIAMLERQLADSSKHAEAVGEEVQQLKKELRAATDAQRPGTSEEDMGATLAEVIQRTEARAAKRYERALEGLLQAVGGAGGESGTSAQRAQRAWQSAAGSAD